MASLAHYIVDQPARIVVGSYLQRRYRFGLAETVNVQVVQNKSRRRRYKNTQPELQSQRRRRRCRQRHCIIHEFQISLEMCGARNCPLIVFCYLKYRDTDIPLYCVA